MLLTVKSRIDRGEPVDAATFCSLIRNGDAIMAEENWKTVTDRYYSAAEKEEWASRVQALPEGFDMQAYGRQWEALGARIEAALPLDPKSAAAAALYDEWQALLAPFRAAATPAMMTGAANLYNRMDEWEGQQKPPFSMEVWTFIQKVGASRA